MTDICSQCGEKFSYEVGWDDPPEGAGHIKATWNPPDKPSFVVGETRTYCSVECLQADEELSEVFG